MLNLCTFSDNLQYKSTLQIKFFACEFLELNRSKSFAAFLVTKRFAARTFLGLHLRIQILPLLIALFRDNLIRYLFYGWDDLPNAF